MSELKIYDPGFYNLGRAEYDAAAGIRNTELGWAAKSMRHYAHYKQFPPGETAAKRDGQLIHRAILEPEEFDKTTVVLPEDAPNRPSIRQREAKKPSPATIEAIAWWSDFGKKHAGKAIISAEESREILNIIEAVWKDKEAGEILRNCKRRELAVFSRHESTGLLLKSSLDLLTADDSEIWDIKTTVDGEPEAYRRAVTNFGYHRQAAFYPGHFPRLGLKRPAFGHIIVEKEPPYMVSVRPFDDESIEIGRAEVSALLHRIAHSQQTKSYPGYHTGRELTGLTYWKIKEAMQ